MTCSGELNFLTKLVYLLPIYGILSEQETRFFEEELFIHGHLTTSNMSSAYVLKDNLYQEALGDYVKDVL